MKTKENSFSTQIEDFPEEIWVDVRGWDGIYQVSNIGRIKSLFRLDTIGRRVKEKILSQNYWVDKKRKNHVRHIKVQLMCEGREEKKYVSRIVWESFNDYIDDDKEILHLDGNVINNNILNLSVGTRSDRFVKDYKNGVRTLHIKEYCKNMKGKKFKRVKQRGKRDKSIELTIK